MSATNLAGDHSDFVLCCGRRGKPLADMAGRPPWELR